MSQKPKRELTARQKLFVKYYQRTMNATQAAILAGYSAKNADKIGPRLVGKSRVKAAIDLQMAKRLARMDITNDRILDEIALIAFSDITDFVDFNQSGVDMKDSSTISKRKRRAIAEVSQVMNEYGGTVKFKLHSKEKALEMLGKFRKLFTEKVEHSGKVTLADLLSGDEEPETKS